MLKNLISQFYLIYNCFRSNDGKILVISSTDGYCSIIVFADGELGVVYDSTKQEKKQEEKMEVCNKDDSKKVKSNKKLKAKKNINIKSEDILLTFLGKITPLKNNKSKVKNEEIETIDLEKIEDKKDDLEGMKIEKKLDVDEDFQLILEESMTQSKLINEVNKRVDNNKPILVLEKDTNQKDLKEGENKPATVVVDESVINMTKGDNKFSSLILDKVIDLDQNKPVSEVSPQKEDKSKVDSSLVSPKSNTVPIGNVTPGQSQKKTPRRVQLITLSSPKGKKKSL